MSVFFKKYSSNNKMVLIGSDQCCDTWFFSLDRTESRPFLWPQLEQNGRWWCQSSESQNMKRARHFQTCHNWCFTRTAVTLLSSGVLREIGVQRADGDSCLPLSYDACFVFVSLSKGKRHCLCNRFWATKLSLVGESKGQSWQGTINANVVCLSLSETNDIDYLIGIMYVSTDISQGRGPISS